MKMLFVITSLLIGITWNRLSICKKQFVFQTDIPGKKYVHPPLTSDTANVRGKEIARLWAVVYPEPRQASKMEPFLKKKKEQFDWKP